MADGRWELGGAGSPLLVGCSVEAVPRFRPQAGRYMARTCRDGARARRAECRDQSCNARQIPRHRGSPAARSRNHYASVKIQPGSYFRG